MFSWGLFLIIIGICILLFWKNKNRMILWLKEQNTMLKKKLSKKKEADFTLKEYLIHNVTDRINDWNPNINIVPMVTALIGVLITISVGFMVLTQVKEAISTSTVNSTELSALETGLGFFSMIPIILIGVIVMAGVTAVRMFK